MLLAWQEQILPLNKSLLTPPPDPSRVLRMCCIHTCAKPTWTFHRRKAPRISSPVLKTPRPRGEEKNAAGKATTRQRKKAGSRRRRDRAGRWAVKLVRAPTTLPLARDMPKRAKNDTHLGCRTARSQADASGALLQAHPRVRMKSMSPRQ